MTTNLTATKNHRRFRTARGSTLLMTLVYTLMFGALASSMVAFSQGNMVVQQAETDADQALVAAESGMSYLLLQFRTVGLPAIKEGNIASMTTPSLLWAGTKIESITFTGTSNNNNNGIAVQLAAALNASGALTSGSVITPAGTNPLTAPAIKVDPANSNATFTLSVAWDPSNPHAIAGTNTSYCLLKCTSTGTSNYISRSVTMDVWIQKTLKYAVYSNVAIQLGKNVRVKGDIASTYTGTDKGPPVQMVSDWHYIANKASIDTDLANLRGLLSTYDSAHANRLNVSDPSSSAAIAAKNAGLKDLNGDGYIDDFDIGLKNFDNSISTTTPRTNGITSGDFTNGSTGKLYDADLFSLVDSPMGALDANGNLPNGSPSPWTGYNDSKMDYQDGYAKVYGTVKTALSYTAWQAAASGWSQWGDTSGNTTGKTFNDQFEGPVISPDANTPPVQFGADFSNDQTMLPANFDTSAYDAQVPSTTATKTTSGSTTTIKNGNLTAAMANGTSVTEHSPADVTSGWQATYSRPVFQNVNFTNVRIPKGLNAKFVNCTFNGYTSVALTTNIVKPGTSTTTTDPTDGHNWAEQMTSGTFSPNTTLTDSNNTGAAQGNNLHFSGCTFNGVLTAGVPTAYTHFADSWEFDGTTTFNNSVDQSVTIMAPNTNIEMGSYVNPGSNPSTLVGVVVAGNIDIRGTTNVDGSLLVTGNGATNTTLGYFGTTDQGQAVPTLSQLPTTANGSYGHLFFQNNPNRGMPTGIIIPVLAKPQANTYQIQ